MEPSSAPSLAPPVPARGAVLRSLAVGRPLPARPAGGRNGGRRPLDLGAGSTIRAYVGRPVITKAPVRLSRPSSTTTMIVIVVLSTLVYVGVMVGSRSGPVGSSEVNALLVVSLAEGDSTVVALRSSDGWMTSTAAPTNQDCLRIYRASGTTICLSLSGPGPTYAAAITNADVARSQPLPGVPSRARVSPSGRLVAWTAFVTGDSYTMPGGFSTRSAIMDVEAGTVWHLEDFTAEIGGTLYNAIDINYWGVTFVGDDRSFYATLASDGRTWLVHGDLATRKVTAMRSGVECPSLSPDEQRIAFKKKVGRFGPWELAVLDLQSGIEKALPGTLGIDDQAEWVDDSTLLYSGVDRNHVRPSVHRVPADGSAPPHVVAVDATSPSSPH